MFNAGLANFEGIGPPGIRAASEGVTWEGVVRMAAAR